MKKTRVIPAFGGFLVLAAALHGEDVTGLRVIVSASNAVSELPRERIADLFLKKVATWEDGKAALSVDQSMAFPLRARFSQQILGRLPSAVQKYWEERIFSGRGEPPPIKRSDAEVVEFVAKNVGAIGYVSEQAVLPPGVKVLRVTN